MAAVSELRGYVDDSGHYRDPNHNVVAMACYLARLEKWRVFERRWREVLSDNKVPYLHMKEWWQKDNSIYSHIKGYASKEASFFSDLSDTIRQNVSMCAISYVRLPALKKISSKYCFELNPYSLALYGCLISLRQSYWDEDFQIIIDKVEKPYLKIDAAKAYAKSDVRHNIRPDKIPITPIEDSQSAKSVLPLQAADFMAWELRKNSEETLTWDVPESTKTVVQAARDYGRWATEFAQKNNREPRIRKSAWSLYKGTRVQGVMWDETTIAGAHVNLHPNGWGV